jgi:hypothetical protein
MKTIRRKRITIREKEVVISTAAAASMDERFCPFCHAPIQAREIPDRTGMKSTTGNETVLSNKY